MVGIIGDPVAHSLSPAIHNAAFRSLGLDWVYVAFPVLAEQVSAALAGMRALGITGLNVTMPHKPAAAVAVDRLSATAAALGAVNTVVRRDDGLHGESTDGEGLLRALRAEPGFDPDGRRCLVVGAGGSARAAILALAGAGAREVVVVARRSEAAARAAALAGHRGRVGHADEVADVDLVVHATPAGMGVDRSPLPIDPARLASGQVVVDLVYDPPLTPLVAAARAGGATAVNGLGMLVHQAALSFRLWTGVDPPLDVMTSAATVNSSP